VILELLGRELARSLREKENIGLILCDLDRFKTINDTYGHLVGDEVLRETARRLLGSVRSYDYVGRYGGEEFLIVLSNCDVRHTEARAEQIRQAISGKPIHTGAGSLNVTMSLGLLLSAEWAALSVEALLSEVDAALYAAKAAGRNCLRLAAPAHAEVAHVPRERVPRGR
jgi:diguanylate cyclase (GGDEF)-like protein